jgi:predicted aldo/keto reductase-like oxidoreductase
MSTCTIFGAAALGSVTQADADRTLDVLLEYGINHIDTANSYGEAEKRLGPWMGQHRKDFFLATKSENRTYAGAREHLHRSLDLLKTDSIDLWQMHILVKPEDWDVAMGPGGALEAFVEARDQGLVRFLGVTGHEVTIPEMHRRSLERYDFDAVLLPYNYALMQNPQYANDFERLIELCQQRNVAVQTIKSLTRGPWEDNQPHTSSTWYEPFTEQADIDVAVQWVLRRPGIFLNTAGDIHLLPKILDAASRMDPANVPADIDEQIAAIVRAPLFV